ncbi:Origin recognition complex subunit 5 [Porphyridium purpureum]|uniref:Origin recognition complex subunit 5 n=1 Tax=Porphyridium purpureum TaxID=35688 RepID=A0A5J4YMQ0_PORPP|nr:Origin recognition complex subunit 5 [Porphyridium purpureum]|eukprot:POR0155..scf295_9
MASPTPELAHLTDTWPERAAQIRRMSALLGARASFLVYGPAATGKTELVCDTLAFMGRSIAFAYVDCKTFFSEAHLFESLAVQVCRAWGDGLDSELNSDTSSENTHGHGIRSKSDFVHLLMRLSDSDDVKHRERIDRHLVLVLDGAERISRICPPAVLCDLAQLESLILSCFDRRVHVSALFISEQTWDVIASQLAHDMGCTLPMISVAFPLYTSEQLRTILRRTGKALRVGELSPEQVQRKWNATVDLSVATLSKATCNLVELRRLTSCLFPHYVRISSQSKEHEHNAYQIMKEMNPFLQRAMSAIYRLDQPIEEPVSQVKGLKSPRRTDAQIGDMTDELLRTVLSSTQKELLVSIYLATLVPETRDAEFFDAETVKVGVSVSGRGSKRTRTGSTKSMAACSGHSAPAEQPKIPMERVLAVHRSLLTTGQFGIAQSLSQACMLQSVTQELTDLALLHVVGANLNLSSPMFSNLLSADSVERLARCVHADGELRRIRDALGAAD